MTPKTQLAELTEGVINSDHRRIGRAISLLENSQSDDAHMLLSELWPHTGRATTLGITGPPGAGKSTLTSALITHLREQDKTVGVIAVDPSSPVSKGALLGDRIRMADHYTDPDVFIRSMSSRGHLGGTSEAAFLGMSVLDAAGKDVVIVETVGVGQSEVEVRSMVDTVAVVLQPESGDSVQMLKSGIMEIPDVLCLNKSDRLEAEKTRRALKIFLNAEPEPTPIYVETKSLDNLEIQELWAAVQEHRQSLGKEGLHKLRRSNLAEQMSNMVASFLLPAIIETFTDGDEELVELVETRNIDPLTVVDEVIKAR